MHSYPKDLVIYVPLKTCKVKFDSGVITKANSRFLEFQGGRRFTWDSIFKEIGTKDLLSTMGIDHCREERA